MDVSEKVFKEYLDIRVINSITISKNSEGRYNITLSIKGKEQEVRMLTTRGEWRSWSSLDRLIRLLESKTNELPTIILKIPPVKKIQAKGKKDED